MIAMIQENREEAINKEEWKKREKKEKWSQKEGGRVEEREPSNEGRDEEGKRGEREIRADQGARVPQALSDYLKVGIVFVSFCSCAVSLFACGFSWSLGLAKLHRRGRLYLYFCVRRRVSLFPPLSHDEWRGEHYLLLIY